MARVAASIAVFLFFLFTFSRARDIQYLTSESKSAAFAEIHEPDKSKPQQHDTVSFTLDSVDPVPLTLLNFRPINRHVHPRRPLPLPLSIRRCRHGHHRREIPYGNDAIVLTDAAATDRSGRVRRIPGTFVRSHAAEARFPEMMAHHDAHHHHHHFHSEHHHHEKGWFAKKVHEFFNLF